MTNRLLVFIGLACLSLAACGSGDGTATPATSELTDTSGTTAPGVDTTSAPDTTEKTGDGTGVVAIRIEDVGGIFIEGFEVGIRFEDSTGEAIDATLWSEFVQGQDGDALDDYYDSVLEQPVPAGTVVVLATATVGMGPGPVIPDVDGDLECRLEVDVPDGGRVAVEVGFSGDADCLREV